MSLTEMLSTAVSCGLSPVRNRICSIIIAFSPALIAGEKVSNRMKCNKNEWHNNAEI
jgi:hypothetical protein